MSLVSIRKKGYLYKLPVNAGVIKKWNKRWFVLHATTHDGVVRLDYYEREEHEATEIGKRTIPLRECMGLSSGVSTKSHSHVFEFKTPIGVHTMAAPSETEKNEWLEAIKEAIREDMLRRKKKKVPGPPSVKHVVREDGSTAVKATRKGATYDPSLSGVYRVTLEQNETTQRLNISGAYNLEVTPTGIALIAAHSGASLAEWQYKHVKSYGKQGGNFSLDSGRLSETGEGSFTFITSCGKEIFGIVHRNIKKLKSERDAAMADRSEVVARRKKGRNGDASAAAKKRLSVGESYKVTDQKPHPRAQRRAPDPPTGAKGTYRRSAEVKLDGASSKDDPHVYETLPGVVKADPAKLYSKVDKSRKKSKTEPTPPGLPPRLYRGASMYETEPPPPSYDTVTTRNHPQPNWRTSRDSAVLEGKFDNPLASMEDDLPPLGTGVSNPLVDYTNFDELDMDEFDDHLFEALDQFELNDDEPDIGEDLEMPQATSSQRAPQAAARKPPTDRRMSQQEFDQMWDDICATIPNVNSTDFL